METSKKIVKEDPFTTPCIGAKYVTREVKPLNRYSSVNVHIIREKVQRKT